MQEYTECGSLQRSVFLSKQRRYYTAKHVAAASRGHARIASGILIDHRAGGKNFAPMSFQYKHDFMFVRETGGFRLTLCRTLAFACQTFKLPYMRGQNTILRNLALKIVECNQIQRVGIQNQRNAG